MRQHTTPKLFPHVFYTQILTLQATYVNKYKISKMAQLLSRSRRFGSTNARQKTALDLGSGTNFFRNPHSRMQSQQAEILGKWKGIIWIYPSNSHHQDYYIVRESQPNLHLWLGILAGGVDRRYDNQGFPKSFVPKKTWKNFWEHVMQIWSYFTKSWLHSSPNSKGKARQIWVPKNSQENCTTVDGSEILNNHLGWD